MRDPLRDAKRVLRTIDENRERYRRSNRGGDDTLTRIVFVLVVLAFVGWAVRFWIVAHTVHPAP